ncbi:hypothetical protein CSV86_029635 [Pseudomonas putida CSV86]|uniref:Uncharacterized protein n=1 Tax=Pseudomonas bharatica CSV86 TaxID=1005395 RepID=A0A7K4EMS2_9PSED|nr:hypothetical protein [Pseudomonas bharatica]NNJ18974.1 hypothetical protein [Pseudomonas bharatica CSV86]
MNQDIVEPQHRLKRQVACVGLLQGEFLNFVWAEAPATYDELNARFVRLLSELDSAGGLPPILVMQLFDALEQKAFAEIRKPTALAETTRPDDLAAKLPKRYIKVAKAVRKHAYKEMQSNQAKSASRRPRPAGKHPDRDRVINLLRERLANGQFVPGRKLEIAKFVREIYDSYPRLGRHETIRNWVKNHLKTHT